MASEVTYTFQDYSREKSNVRFKITSFTAAGYDALLALLTALEAAVIGLQTENALQSRKYTAVNTFVKRDPAAEQATQRELKWLCLFEDDTLHTVFRHEIPHANSELLTQQSDMLATDAAAYTAFETAANAVVRAPSGNTASLLSIQFVGKRI